MNELDYMRIELTDMEERLVQYQKELTDLQEMRGLAKVMSVAEIKGAKDLLKASILQLSSDISELKERIEVVA